MAAGALTEEVVEVVADHLEEAAVATRMLNARVISSFLGGVGVGIGIGFYFGNRWNREQIKAEAFAQSEEEVAKIREAYQNRLTERPVSVPLKPDVEDIIAERGYSVRTAQVEEQIEKKIEEEAEEITSVVVEGVDIDLSQRPLPAPVPVREPLHATGARDTPVVDSSKKVIRTEEMSKEKDDGWNWPYEMSQRSTDSPCIIHQDEYTTNETEYNQETYTYFSGDQVLADTDDTIIHNVDELVGLENLHKFGHGSDDFNVLYVRNSKLELEMEICRSSGSYEQEVSGLEHSSFERMPRRHRRSEDDDEA